MTETSTPKTWSRRASRDPSGSRPSRIPLAFLVCGAAVQAGLALHLGRNSWFGVDSVNYLTTRGPVPSADLGLLRPYGGHWQTIPLLVYRGLFAVFGMGSYLPYLCVAVAIHLFVTFVLYALIRSVGVSGWSAAIPAWLVLFYGAGSEAFLGDGPMVLTGSLALGLVAALVMSRRRFSPTSRVVGAVLVLASVMCSGTGLVAAVTVGCFVAFRVGLRAAVAVSGPAVLAFTVWFLTLGRDGRVHLTWQDVPHIPGFVWSGLTGSLESVLGIPGTGGVIAIGLVLVVVRFGSGPAALGQLSVAGLVGALTQLVLSSFASFIVGDQAARVGRYEYLVLVLSAASLALVLETVVRRGRLERLASRARGLLLFGGALLLAAATVQGISLERRQSDFSAGQARLYKTWVYGGLMATDAGEKQLVTDAGSGFNGGRFELFAAPQLRGRLGSGPTTRTSRLDAESEYFVDVTDTDLGLFASTRITVTGMTGRVLRAEGCQSLTIDGTGPATIDVQTGQGTEIGLMSNSTTVSTQLFRSYVPSSIRTWLVTPGPVYVATTAKGALLRVVINGSGTVSLCHK